MTPPPIKIRNQNSQPPIYSITWKNFVQLIPYTDPDDITQNTLNFWPIFEF